MLGYLTLNINCRLLMSIHVDIVEVNIFCTNISDKLSAVRDKINEPDIMYR